MLSREAIIKLGAPRFTDIPLPTDFVGPSPEWLACRQWHISHSTQPQVATKRNARLSFRSAPEPGNELIATHSHQNLNSPAIKSLESKLLSVNADGVGNITFKDTSNKREYEILAWGKEGQLEDWMIEDGLWISDSSGERRGDWRNSYVVALVNEETWGPSIEVWDQFGPASLSSKTLEKIRTALKEIPSTSFQALADQLKPTKADNGRDADDEENWKRHR
ncbi:hypothetical protein B0H67DRAFT_595514 [Lasiosphaeris hirsuta]|uniref:Uncharacterized protein n=1 Tax=Lasiosphaeris hirsuta TaxID=260670 RepID=A0AA39ZRL9_9PEZI|nr:hypothetical protein B0H67DRAFT_595514 [Lasiosphaeris hirsuta]